MNHLQKKNLQRGSIEVGIEKSYQQVLKKRTLEEAEKEVPALAH